MIVLFVEPKRKIEANAGTIQRKFAIKEIHWRSRNLLAIHWLQQKRKVEANTCTIQRNFAIQKIQWRSRNLLAIYWLSTGRAPPIHAVFVV